MSIERLRAGLDTARDLHFLNFAATAPMLDVAASAIERVARAGRRPLAEHFTTWLAELETARRRVAGTIGACVDEITFTTNTSTALSLVAGAIRWKPGDRVLYPADEFPSNRFVWMNLADMGVKAEAVPYEPGVGFVEQLARRDLSRVRLVALSAVSYRDGRRLDVEQVAALGRERGFLVAVDAIQAVGAVPVDTSAWGCDFLACGGQKWLLGPVGSAFLFVRRERLEELHVPTAGWASSRHAGDHEAQALQWTDGAARFEAGLPDIAAIAGLGASLAAFADAGWSEVFGAVAVHRARLAAELEARGIEVQHGGLPGANAGIVTARIPPESMGALEAGCDRRDVIVTHRRDAVRLAAHATTTDADLDAFLEAVDETLRPRRRARTIERTAPVHEPVPSIEAATPWRHALVTGASRGLGAAFATALAPRGCALTLIARDRVALDALAAALESRYHVAVEVCALDLSDARAVDRWIADTGERLGGIDLLVNNAAHAHAALFLDGDRDGTVERTALQVNVMAPIALARAVMPGMVRRGRGAILNVATTGARNALPLFSAYAASKAALWAWSEALGRELDGTGVTVTTFVPPHMDTATRRQLGRAAAGFYDLGAAGSNGRGGGAEGDLLAVARRALDAAAAGRPTVMPRRARLETIFNAVSSERVAAQVRRRWKRSSG